MFCFTTPNDIPDDTVCSLEALLQFIWLGLGPSSAEQELVPNQTYHLVSTWLHPVHSTSLRCPAGSSDSYSLAMDFVPLLLGTTTIWKYICWWSMASNMLRGFLKRVYGMSWFSPLALDSLVCKFACCSSCQRCLLWLVICRFFAFFVFWRRTSPFSLWSRLLHRSWTVQSTHFLLLLASSAQLFWQPSLKTYAPLPHPPHHLFLPIFSPFSSALIFNFL